MNNLPNNHELFKQFSFFLVESGLSEISIKNYLSDIRHFQRFLENKKQSDLAEVFQNITKYINDYVLFQKSTLTPSASINRRLASIRRLSTFLSTSYQIHQQATIDEMHLNASSPTSDLVSNNSFKSNTETDISSKKILDQFKQRLISEKKTHSTVKNYLSDLYHYFSWTANHTPYNVHHLEQVLSSEQLNTYINYLKLTNTSGSVISRRQSSIKKLTTFCFSEKYIPTNPFEVVIKDTKLAPLAWLTRHIPKLKTQQNAPKSRFAVAYHKYHSLSFTPYLHLAILVLATTTMAILAYNQLIKQAKPSSAATSLVPPRRQLSFQGRLSDSSGTPINTAINVVFKLWDDDTAGSQLYTTGTCSVTPDTEGVFNSLIGDTVCGAEIPQSVFADNRDIYLEVSVGAETLTPRQQIATVGYALNSETLQGYPASSAATINTVPVVDNSGNINIAASSPAIISSSGNFNLQGQSLSLATTTNSGGDIVLQPDAIGSGQILAIGGTTTEDTFRITNANLTTGSLLSGYIGNDTATGSGNLLLLSSGATESARFRVTADGRTTITTATASADTAALTVDQNGTGNIFSASASGVTKFNIANSGSINVLDGVAHTIDDVSGDLTLGSNSNTINLNDNVTFAGTTTLNSQTYTWPNSAGSNGYILQTNGSGTLSWVDINTSISNSNLWQESNGLLFPKNSTVDFVIGGQSTDSAKFAVLNINNGTPTASISSGLAGAGAFLDATGLLATTNLQTLTLGNSTTGNILIGTGSNNIDLDSNTWSISGAGDATGFTGLSSAGVINFSGLSASSAVYTDASSNLTSLAPTTGILGFWQRNSGVLAPWFTTDSINIGGTATTSALVHLGGTAGESSFFLEPLAIGFDASTSPITNPGLGGGLTALQVDGDILPGVDDDAFLGRASMAWNRLYLSNGINNSTGTEQISIANRQLTGGQWNATTSLRVGDTTNSMPTGREFYVVGDASVSATLFIGGTSELLGNVTIGNGTGKLDVGTVDPPYTIDGEKYATYLSGMIGVKEEVTGSVITNEYLQGLGYRKTINFNSLEKGSDLWLFGKTTNISENFDRISVLLTPQSQSKTWYQVDKPKNVLYIYSSSPTQISYRLTAPRFDAANWTNTRVAGVDGFIINTTNTSNTENSSNVDQSYSPSIANIDGLYEVISNGNSIKDIANFSDILVANMRAGLAVVNELFVDNLVINSKLISPIANIDELNAINASISGSLYADNIKGKTIDKLNEQLDILNDKYATASAILASIQEKYSQYDSIFSTPSISTTSSDIDPLLLSPLATTSGSIPEDIALNNINVGTVIANDVLANGSIFTQSLSSFEGDLFIQPGGEKSIHLLANLMTLYPNGQVLIDGDLIVTGNIFANNIDTRTATISGSLALGKGNVSTESAQLLALFNESGKVVGSVDASGSASFDKLTTQGIVIASENNLNASNSAQTATNSTIGSASIATSSSEIFIANNNVNDNTLVYITPISDTDNQVLFVKSKQSNSGFTIALPQPATKEISFNFWLVQTK